MPGTIRSMTVGTDAAVTFTVTGTLMYGAIAASCSSPQTTELNAGKRATTLMKWVHIGIAQGLLLTAVTAYLSDEPWAAIAGGVGVAALMYAQYWHARDAGLKSSAGGTESY
jgi:hypothetical protein